MFRTRVPGRASSSRAQAVLLVTALQLRRRSASRCVGTPLAFHRPEGPVTPRVHWQSFRRCRVAGFSALAPVQKPSFRREVRTSRLNPSGCVRPAFVPSSDEQRSRSAVGFSVREPYAWVARPRLTEKLDNSPSYRSVLSSKSGQHWICHCWAQPSPTTRKGSRREPRAPARDGSSPESTGRRERRHYALSHPQHKCICTSSSPVSNSPTDARAGGARPVKVSGAQGA